MIAIRELTRRYGGTLAVNDLTCTVRAGVVTGFLGPNGAGASTTMRLMLGLDRGGVRWIRSLPRDPAEEGRTVFVSSHLLSEAVLLADDLVVIGEGRLIAAEPVQAFIDAHTRTYVLVRTAQAERFGSWPHHAGFRVRQESTDALVVDSADPDAWHADVPVSELHVRRSSLEDVFLHATIQAAT